MKRSRKILSLIMTVAMVFTALPGTGIFWSYAEEAGSYTVSMSSNSGEVTAGGEFDVTLSVSSETEGAKVAALHSVVEYDASKVEYVKASAPADSGLDVAASAKDGAVTVESYGKSQSASSDGGAAMAVLKFKAKDSASGSAVFSLSAGKSFIGRSGDSADIPAAEGEALSVDLIYDDPNKFDLVLGIKDDGLTWNLLTVNDVSVEKSVAGGTTISNIVAKGDKITFSITPDEGVQYTNVVFQDMWNMDRRTSTLIDTAVPESGGIYTATMVDVEGRFQPKYVIDASTLRVEDNEHAYIAASLSTSESGSQSDDGSPWRKNIEVKIDASAKVTDGSRLIRWSYSENGKEWKSWGAGDTADDGTYILSKTGFGAGSYIGLDRGGYYYGFGNECMRLRAEFTSDTVREISTEADLRRFAASVNSGDPYTDVTVKLLNDITLTASWDEPIGKGSATPFSGTFEGGGHTISGLKIEHTYTTQDGRGSDYYGLFGYVKGAAVKDLTVSGSINIDDTSRDFESANQGDGNVYVGGIAGYSTYNVNRGNALFQDCTSEVDITSYSGYVGGIVGHSDGYYSKDYLLDTVSLTGTSFIDCFNYGDITITKRNMSACGITGYIATSLERCGNYGDVNIKCGQLKVIEKPPASSGGGDGVVKTYDVGTGSAAGLAVYCIDNVSQCFNKANIIGTALRIGGLIAGLPDDTSYDAELKVSDSYNRGRIELPVKHYDYRYYKDEDEFVAAVSGLVGPVKGSLTLTNCYSAAGTVVPLIEGTNGLQGSLYTKNSKTDSVEIVNCYADDTDPSVSGLKADSLNTDGSDTFKDDENLVNGGMPLLKWEASEGSDQEYSVSFDTKGISAQITLYADAEHKNVIEPVNGAYKLKAGSYYYRAVASEAGYEEVQGSFSVLRKDVSISINFKAIVDMTVTVSPADAELKVTTSGGETVQPKSHNGGSYVFTLYKGSNYVYTVTASGYNGKTQTFVADGKPVSITLTKSSWSGGETADSAIYGSYNTGKTSTITKGGTYNIQKGSDVRSQGRITISTSEPVTLVGRGYSNDDMYEDLYIKYTVANADLTIKDLYIHNTLNCEKKTDMGNIIDFTGTGNELTVSGTNILDWDGNASGYAAIHVNQKTDLTISGGSSDTLYLYKHEQGAGIGGNGGADGGEGQSAETNGDITFTGGTYFIKNSKQGAGIGAGAQAGSLKPGKIRFEGGSFYIIANSRGASIGGSAGSGGASAGSDVYVSDSASITINVDFAGAAIGGGGHSGGNDSDGGTLYYDSGSVRTFIDTNAVSQWSVTRAGVNGNKAITANVVSSSGNKPLYLLELDTSKLTKSASRFTVKEGSSTVYSGRLHEYRYVNEDTEKNGQSTYTYTIDNWTSLDDSQLYLYMTGDDHTLDVNGETVTAKWDASAKTFTLTYPDGTTGTGGSAGGSLAGDQTPLVSETVKPDVSVSGSNAKADVKKDAVDGAVKAVGSSSNAEIAIDAVSGKSGITHAEVSLPMESVKTIQKDTKADIIIKTDLGDITVDNSDLSSLTTGSGSDVKFTIDKNADGSMKVGIASGGKELAAGREIVKFKYKIDDALMKSLGGKTGVGNSGLAGAVVGAKGADGKAQLDIMRDSYVTADGYLITYAPVGGAVTVTANGRDFGDVAANAWYAKAVGFAVSHELFNGVSDNEFAPSKSMTRGMFVTVLNRLAEAEDFSGKNDFTDVASDKWYATGTAWAASKGIVNGYGDGKFGPDDEVTREQMAVIMYNFTKAMGYDMKGSASLAKFSDSASVHSWASEAMQWAVGAGVMSGNADGTLNPRGTATRAQVATIMMNYVQVLLGAK